jgi:ParB family transcriptional regulator, chromosome partitioning protein
MLAFRSHMQESNQRVQELEKRLEAFEGGQLQKDLDADKVHPSRWANRHHAAFATADFEALKLDIQAAGRNVQPILVRPLADRPGEYEIVFGHRRHRACQELGLPVTAVISSLDDRSLFAAMDRENRARKDLSPFEQGDMYRRALDEGLYASLRQMAQELGVDAGNVSKAMAIARLPAEVLAAFESPLVIQYRWGQQLHVAVQKDPEGVIARAKSIRNSPKRIAPAQVLARLLDAGVPAKSTVSVFRKKGRMVGSLAQATDGSVKIQLSAGALQPAQLAQIAQAIEAALNS